MGHPRHAWLIAAWGAGAAGALLDWAVLLVAKSVFGLPTALAVVSGLLAGNSVNFIVNRRFAFPFAAGTLGAQALRYLMALGLAIPVHASLMVVTVEGRLLPLALAKVACDTLVFAFLFPVLLKTFVFASAWRPMFAPRLPI